MAWWRITLLNSGGRRGCKRREFNLRARARGSPGTDLGGDGGRHQGRTWPGPPPSLRRCGDQGEGRPRKVQGIYAWMQTISRDHRSSYHIITLTRGSRPGRGEPSRSSRWDVKLGIQDMASPVEPLPLTNLIWANIIPNFNDTCVQNLKNYLQNFTEIHSKLNVYTQVLETGFTAYTCT